VINLGRLTPTGHYYFAG